MKLVIDANILFTSLIKDDKTAEIILDNRIQLFSAEFLFEVFLKYRELIIKKTHRTR
jgi:predicted nucleic acid-binding protein